MRSSFAAIGQGLQSIVWLVQYGVTHSRRQSAVVLPLLVLAFLLQISLVALIVLFSRIVAGGPVDVWGLFTLNLGQQAVATGFGLIAVLVLLLCSSFVTYLTSVRLRQAGRAVHVSALHDLTNRFEDPEGLQGLDHSAMNRLVHQACLQLGVAYEALLRLVQPLTMLILGAGSLLKLHPLLLPLLVATQIPVAPLLYREVRRLVRLSDTFTGTSAREASHVFNEYFESGMLQNVLPTSGDKERALRDPRLLAYLNNYDTYVLSSERMSFLFSMARPLLFLVAIVYLMAIGDGSTNMLKDGLPTIFVIYYLSIAATAGVTQATSVIRFFPQISSLSRVLSMASVPRARQAKLAVPSAPLAFANRPVSISPGKRYFVKLGGHLDRAKVADLASKLTFANGQPGSTTIHFMSGAYLFKNCTAKDALTLGRHENWGRVERWLAALQPSDVFDVLPDRENTILTNKSWDVLVSRSRSIFQIFPLLLSSGAGPVALEMEAITNFNSRDRSTVLGWFDKRPLILNVQTNTPDWSLTSDAIIVDKGRAEIVDRVDFEGYVAARPGSKDSATVPLELLVEG